MQNCTTSKRVNLNNMSMEYVGNVSPSKRFKRNNSGLPTLTQTLLLACCCLMATFTFCIVLRDPGYLELAIVTHEREATLHVRAASVCCDGLSLTRAEPLLHLEKRIDEDPQLGACYQQQSLLDSMPHSVCKSLTCLWSESVQRGVDMETHPLQLLPISVSCPIPAGGQRGVPGEGQPEVSFVIAMHNGAQNTAQSLFELFRTAGEADSAEYVLVNDGSTEDVSVAFQTLELLVELFGIKSVVIMNEKALGYGEASTQGIQASTGRLIVLVNNDMFVAKGWLSAIKHTFKHQPKAGLVGPIFLGRDGTIQEAGGLVFRNGNAWNYARNEQVQAHLLHLRESDYVSAACLVFRRELFAEIGGFDPQYTMGYYEDTDLAMSARAAGYSVLVQPLAVVYHQEGGTFGTEETSDTKKQLMVENGQKFKQKWAAELQDHCDQTLGPTAASQRFGSPRILWIDDIVPEPDKDSGSIRNLNIMHILQSEGYHITFIPTAGGRDPRYTSQLRSLGVEVAALAPPEHWELTTPEGECRYDVLFVARRAVYQQAQEVLLAKCPGKPIVYDTVDLHFLREARDAITTPVSDTEVAEGQGRWLFERLTTTMILEWLEGPDAEEVRDKRRVELALIDASDLVVVVSPQEVELIKHYRPDTKVMVLSNIHQVPPLPPMHCEGRSGLLFVGNMNHIPNRQAVSNLIQQILPLILRLLPAEESREFTVHIVGANVVPDYLKKLIEANKDRVQFHGYLPDDQLLALYRRIKVVAAPLLSGAGVKGKVNQAMKYGVPVVATPLAVEGMFPKDGEDCLVASSAAEFAEKVVRAYTDCGLWERLVKGGHRNVMLHFSYEKAKAATLQVFASVGVPPRPSWARGTC